MEKYENVFMFSVLQEESHEYILLYSFALYTNCIRLLIKKRSQLRFQVKDSTVSKFLLSIYRF